MFFNKSNPFAQFSRNRHQATRDTTIQSFGDPALSQPNPMPVLLPNNLNQNTDEIVSARINEQTGCPLYSKLPAEIREHIFRYIISGDGNVVHIFQRYPKMSYWRCTGDSQPCTWENPCSKTLPQYGHRIDRGQNRVEKFNSDWGVVALMRTCKRL
jgi:hypothetical protein